LREVATSRFSRAPFTSSTGVPNHSTDALSLLHLPPPRLPMLSGQVHL
jgi:hypothetical protein